MNTDISIRETRAAPRRTSILESVRASEIGAFFDPTQTSAENGTASVLSSTINLCNTLMGTGMLAMPTVSSNHVACFTAAHPDAALTAARRRCQVIAVSGWIPGLVLLFLMCFCNIFTVEVVFRLCRIAGPPTSLSEIGDKAAARGSIVIDLAVALNCIGVASSYVIISTGNFYYVSTATTHPRPPITIRLTTTCYRPLHMLQTFGGPRSVWVLVTIAIATPLAFIKDMDSLRHTFFAAVAILLYIVVLVAVYAIIGTCDGDKSNGEYCPPGETAVATDFVGALRSFGEMGTLGVR